jgi:hypothetical protein
VNLYVTFDDRTKIKKCFLNLRKYLIINSEEIIERLGFSKDNLDICSSFIVNEEICRMITEGVSSKKLLGIVYSNPEFNDEIMREVIHFSQDIRNLESVIFLTDKWMNEEYYELFEEVLFYPTIKKVHMINCVPLPVVWLDGLEKLDRDLLLNQRTSS